MIAWLWNWVTFAVSALLAIAVAVLILYVSLCELVEVLLVPLCTSATGGTPQWQALLCALFETSAAARAPYLAARARVLAHPFVAVLVLGCASTAGYLIKRRWTVFWNNEVLARLQGTYLHRDAHGFPSRKYDFEKALEKRKPGHLLVGMCPKPHLRFFTQLVPVTLTPEQRTMHRHVLGKTGSGKTQGVLFPALIQDMRDGRGVFFMDAKGSDETKQFFLAQAAACGRLKDVRIFALPAWNRSDLPSHTWSLTFVPDGGDPVVMAERLFSILQLGANDYYRAQAKTALYCLAKVLHSVPVPAAPDSGVGGVRPFPFTLDDLKRCLFGAAEQKEAPNRVFLETCLKRTTARKAAERFQAQMHQLGAKTAETFTGLCGALDDFDSPLVNTRAPDIVFEEVLEKGLLVYAQLPANMFPKAAKAVGRAMLKDLQQAASMRQVERRSRSQAPFSVLIDEFYNFADLTIIDGLNKLRDAHVEFTLAHQSLADLELVSREYAQAVWDNTLTKEILPQDNPELCERIARSVGTEQKVVLTVRRTEGPNQTSVATADASTQLVEAYKLHPNAIKALKRGQGYQYAAGAVTKVIYPRLKIQQTELALPAVMPRGDDDAFVATLFTAVAAAELKRLAARATSAEQPAPRTSPIPASKTAATMRARSGERAAAPRQRPQHQPMFASVDCPQRPQAATSGERPAARRGPRVPPAPNTGEGEKP